MDTRRLHGYVLVIKLDNVDALARLKFAVLTRFETWHLPGDVSYCCNTERTLPCGINPKFSWSRALCTCLLFAIRPPVDNMFVGHAIYMYPNICGIHDIAMAHIGIVIYMWPMYPEGVSFRLLLRHSYTMCCQICGTAQVGWSFTPHLDLQLLTPCAHRFAGWDKLEWMELKAL